jgi:hypothetical protein
MPTQFTASQSLEIDVIQQPIPIHHYLRQPQRLVNALVDPNRVVQLSEEIFRLKMRPLTFMSLSIQPTVDMRVWSGLNSTVCLESVDCEIIGVEYINQRFSLHLKGYLLPEQDKNGTRLKGQADLKVEVDLPPPFSFMPTVIVETAGNGLLKSVLMTIQQRLLRYLLNDYQQWAIAQGKEMDNNMGNPDIQLLDL